MDVGEEGGELFVIEGSLSRPFGASRAKEQLYRRGLDKLPVDAVPEQLRQQSGHAIGHDRGRAVDNRVQEFDHFPRFDRTRIPVRLVGEFLLKNSFGVFRALAPLAQVPLGEVRACMMGQRSGKQDRLFYSFKLARDSRRAAGNAARRA